MTAKELAEKILHMCSLPATENAYEDPRNGLPVYLWKNLESLLSSALEEAKNEGIAMGLRRGSIDNFQQHHNPEQARKDFYGER